LNQQLLTLIHGQLRQPPSHPKRFVKLTSGRNFMNRLYLFRNEVQTQHFQKYSFVLFYNECVCTYTDINLAFGGHQTLVLAEKISFDFQEGVSAWTLN